MFRKTITRLAYSPALIEELAGYAKQLKHEEAKRQIGLIFIVLAVIVQSFAVFFPPESANAGTSTAFIEGGISNVGDYLRYYDHDTHNIKDLLSSLGISRADVEATTLGTIQKSPHFLVWTAASRGSQNDTAYDFAKPDGTIKTAYYQSFTNYDAPADREFEAYIGSSSTAGRFALLKGSGNLITTSLTSNTCTVTPSPPPHIAVPISMSEAKLCGLKITHRLSARNLTHGVPADSRPAQPSDRIIYTLSVTNNEKYAMSLPLSIGLTDILEYAHLIDKGGATFSEATQTLTWSAATVAADASLTRSFVIKLPPETPSTATGTNEPSSYDCIISSSFGTTLNIPVDCPLPKAVERTIAEFPYVSARTNLTLTAIIVVTVFYFYARTKQLRTELRLIRHNVHQGSL